MAEMMSTTGQSWCSPLMKLCYSFHDHRLLLILLLKYC